MNKKMYKSAEEILKPFVQIPFRHAQIVDKDDAISAMKIFASQSTNWISIKDQTPEDYKKVLFFDSRDSNICIGFFVWSQTPVNYVTHWMFLPENPQL